MNSSISRAFAIILFFAIGFVTAIAQTGKLEFVVKDSTTQKPLGSVTCRVYSSLGKMYRYAISGNGGRLSVASAQNDRLEFSLMGYAKKKLSAGRCSQSGINTILLQQTETQIREVVVKVPPIRAKSDTLVYNVRSFAKDGDRHLEDVLKKLPGVKVSSDGAVSVQGKAINKFYIEGLDLMGSSYNQATRNMPIKAVKSVEVIENHQPVKMLEGRQLSDRAALNIKLDNKHKARLFGEIQAGAGINPDRWDNNLFLTQIMDGSQLLISGKMNNTGTDISTDTKEHIDMTDIDAYEPQMLKALSTEMVEESLPQERYLLNKSYSAGLNWLKKLTDNSTFRCNIVYYGDHSTSSNEISNTYGGDYPLTISESKSYKRKTFALMPIMKYELNSKETFLSDELRYSINRSTLSSLIGSRGASIAERTYSRPAYLQNYLNSSFQLGRLVLRAKSLFRYYDRKESLDNSSESFEIYNLCESLVSKSMMTKNLLSTNVPLFNNYLDIEAKVYYRDNSYEIVSNMHRKQLKLSVLPSYYLRFSGKGGISLGLPIEYSHVSMSGNDFAGKARSYWWLSPTATLRHKFSNSFSATMSASLTASDNASPYYSPCQYFTGYRSIVIPSNNIYRNVNSRASLSLRYRDLVNMFFANLTVLYTHEKAEAYNNYEYTSDYNVITEVEGTNHRHSFMAILSADKSFTDIGLSLKTELSYSQNSYLLSQSSYSQNSYLLSQSQQTTTNHSNIFAVHVESIYQKLKWLRITVDATGNAYWERNGISNSSTLKSLVANASLSLFPIKSVEIKAKMQSMTNEIAPGDYKSSTFIDGSVRYTINKSWAIGGSFSNVLNSKSYVVAPNSGINTYRSVLPLRGREYMVHLFVSL